MSARPAVFPEPREIELREETFAVDEDVVIILPENPSENDRFLAEFLSAEIVDRYHIALRAVKCDAPPAGKRWIAVGTIDNPLVKKIAADRGLSFEKNRPGAEGYILYVSTDGVVAAGRDESGALYALQSLRQLIAKEGDAVGAIGARIIDWPRKPFRSLRIYLPGKEDLAFFKRFLRDFALYFKYNKIILESNSVMRLDRHPELNAGWYELGKDMNYTRRDRPEGPGRQFQDSTHHDAGDFGLLEKDEVAEICRYARRLGMEVIPEIPSLTHAYYLLTRHREFAEIQEAEWPDTYCPLVPEVYDLYFDVLEEYIEVMQPSMVHIGHDEWRMPMDVCERCRGKDYRRLFADDVKKIHGWLKERNIRTAMWGDHLLERVREVAARPTKTPAGYEFNRPGGLDPELVVAEIPKDILLFNWFWSQGSPIGGEENEIQLDEWGFEQVYGNFTPSIVEQDFGRRTDRETILGGAGSAWVRTDEENFAKKELKAYIGVAGLLWSDRWLSSAELTPAAQGFMPALRQYLRRAPSPGEDGEPVTAIDISSACNVSLSEAMPGDSVDLKPGEAAFGWKRFLLGDGDKSLVAVGTKGEGDVALPPSAGPVRIDEDVSSLLFLHSCAQPAQNIAGHFMIYNFDDCADLLGWYEVEYEDGFVVTVPIRYAVNILEWNWAREGGAGQICWQADPIDCSSGGAPVTFFAWEWKNPRFGKAIKSVTLKGSRNFIDAHGKPIASNGVMLAAVSKISKRPAPESEYAGEDF